MPEWQYQVRRIELGPGPNFDQQLEETLGKYGADGWELVEVIPEQDSRNLYRFIFKAPKPLD
jgi:hypothetical protein